MASRIPEIHWDEAERDTPPHPFALPPSHVTRAPFERRFLGLVCSRERWLPSYGLWCAVAKEPQEGKRAQFPWGLPGVRREALLRAKPRWEALPFSPSASPDFGAKGKGRGGGNSSECLSFWERAAVFVLPQLSGLSLSFSACILRCLAHSLFCPGPPVGLPSVTAGLQV